MYNHFFLTCPQALFCALILPIPPTVTGSIILGDVMVYTCIKSNWSMYIGFSHFALCKFLIQFQRIWRKQTWFSSLLAPTQSSSVAKYHTQMLYKFSIIYPVEPINFVCHFVLLTPLCSQWAFLIFSECTKLTLCQVFTLCLKHSSF